MKQRKRPRDDDSAGQAMNVLSHNGFRASVAFDAEDVPFIGRLVGIHDVVGFHAGTVEDLTAAFHEAAEVYLAACDRFGKPAETPSDDRAQAQR